MSKDLTQSIEEDDSDLYCAKEALHGLEEQVQSLGQRLIAEALKLDSDHCFNF